MRFNPLNHLAVFNPQIYLKTRKYLQEAVNLPTTLSDKVFETPNVKAWLSALLSAELLKHLEQGIHDSKLAVQGLNTKVTGKEGSIDQLGAIIGVIFFLVGAASVRKIVNKVHQAFNNDIQVYQPMRANAHEDSANGA